mgnify:CR=1 FL=1|jgi:uncharacterized protein YcbK (DUF882 family)
MKLTTNFNLHEFACNDGTPVPEHLMHNVKELAENLQVLRDYLGEPIRINSAYRHEEYNKRIGGAKKSCHLKAMAADLTCKNKTPRELHKIIEKLIDEKKMKQGGLGLYNGFVHYDIRGVKVRWFG